MQLKIGPYQIHPACAAVPDMKPDEYAELVDSMRRVGFLPDCPVLLYAGEVIDGRHRLRAAIELGVKPLFANFSGATDEDVRNFVVVRACVGRQLSAGQKAVLALGLLPGIQQDAKARMTAGIARNPSDGSSLGSGNAMRSTTVAARAVGVGENSVRIAKQLQEAAPAVLEEVRSGSLTLAAAARKAKPEAASEYPKDCLGQDIEDESVAEAFEAHGPLDDIEKAIRNARAAAKELASTPQAKLFRADQFEAAIGNALRVCKFAKPYAVCPLMPSCKTGGCKHCDGQGWVTKDTYEHMPSELKA